MTATVTPIGGRGTIVTVVDSIMGSGKTTHIIDKMNSDQSGFPFLYITPLLSEVERIKDKCPALNFQEPKPVNGRKLSHLNQLFTTGQNIASTHQLFLMLDEQSRQQLQEANYTLVIDEETECVTEYELKPERIRIMFESELVYRDINCKLRWNYDKWPKFTAGGWEGEIKDLCDNGSLVYVNDTLLIWEFPADFLSLFAEVHILTYLFEGSQMSSYLKANGVPYTRKTLDSTRQLVDPDPVHEAAAKAKLCKLINIVDDHKLNDVGTPKRMENPLSSTWFNRDAKTGGTQTKRLQAAAYNYFNNRVKGKAAVNMWSCFKAQKGTLKGKGYASTWEPCNLKATNDLIDKQNLAYLLNVFLRPRLAQYFRDCGVQPNEDQHALSQLIQWIFRSQIRRGDSINLYLPSQRMRNLLLEWLEPSTGKQSAGVGGARMAA